MTWKSWLRKGIWNGFLDRVLLFAQKNWKGSSDEICGFLPIGQPVWVPTSARDLMDQKEVSVKKKVQNDY